jgi:hypothetical protein
MQFHIPYFSLQLYLILLHAVDQQHMVFFSCATNSVAPAKIFIYAGALAAADSDCYWKFFKETWLALSFSRS